MKRRRFLAGMAAALGASALPAESFQQVKSHAPATSAGPKLSVMLWTVPKKLSFEQRLEKVAAAGYHAVELTDEFISWSDPDFARANAKKRALGMTFDTIAGLATGVANPGARPAFLDDLKHILPTMRKLECNSLIVLSGDRVPGVRAEALHQSCVEALKRAADIAAEAKVTLLLENIDPEENPNYYLTSSREGFAIIREVNHPNVKFCYDLYHEQIAEGNLISTLEKNIDQVGLIHVADVPGRHAPGTGEINYVNIFRKLAHLKYQNYIAMEFEPLGDPVKDLRGARELVVNSWHSRRGAAR